MNAKKIAELVCMWAKEKGVADLETFVASLRTWAFDLEPISGDDALEIARRLPFSPDQIYGAFCPIYEKPETRVRDDTIRAMGKLLRQGGEDGPD